MAVAGPAVRSLETLPALPIGPPLPVRVKAQLPLLRKPGYSGAPAAGALPERGRREQGWFVMARERDAVHSFDPRTWGGAARPPASAAPSAPAQSAPGPAPAPSPARVAPTRATSTSPVWIAFGAAAILLIAGAVVARLYPSREATSVTPTLASSALAGADQPDHLMLAVSEPAGIAEALRGAGVTADVADGAGREVTSMLDGATGDIELVISLDGLPGAREMTRLEATRGTSGVVLTARPDGSYNSAPLPARLGGGM